MQVTDLSTTPAQSTPVPTVYALDTEHLGIRIALPIVMIAAGVLTWIGLSAPLESALYETLGVDGLGGIVSATVGIFTSIVAGIFADRLLKKIWPSGKMLVVEPDQVRFENVPKGADSTITIRLDHRVNLLLWRFVVKRSTPRAQAGWIMFGMQINQDDAQLTLYSFIAPKQAKTLRFSDIFAVIIPPKQSQNTKLGVRETAEQRRLAKAEAMRWDRGAELRPNDFVALTEGVLAGFLEDWSDRSKA